ncbi:hypothetical protein LCGC14_1171100 [marine sediment metagenome]|uniref:Uncharacterized protein n=1 Tax=marine sediment metagenome TaxID=412755 RepID=A0A0F9MCS6_9ZZZZ
MKAAPERIYLRRFPSGALLSVVHEEPLEGMDQTEYVRADLVRTEVNDMGKLPESGIHTPDPNEVFPIGAVGFKMKDGAIAADCLMGPPRVDALRKFFRKQPVINSTLGELIPFVRGYGTIRHDQVNWSTAGKRVTE